MKRICAVCGLNFGEKCPMCGASAVRVGPDTFKCPNERCEVGTFDEGAGGESHGICRDCESDYRNRFGFKVHTH